MRRNKVRLTESQLHQVIKESVKRVLREGNADMDLKGYFSDFGKKIDEIFNKALYDLYNCIAPNADLDGNIRKLYDELYQCQQTVRDICFNRDYHISRNHPSEDVEEPEDWYERNEHGDFDSL